MAIILAAVLALAGAAYWYLSKNGKVAETPAGNQTEQPQGKPAGSPSTPVMQPVSNGTDGQAATPSTAPQKPAVAQYFNEPKNEAKEAGFY